MADRYVKILSIKKVKKCPKYGLIKKLEMDLMKASVNKDR